MRVLIVDDEPLALEWLAQCLKANPKVEVVGAAANAEEAAALIAAKRPDLVLLDICMPGESGLVLARRLKQAGQPEVVFVTAFSDFAPEAFEVDAVDYLLKPVRPDRLKEAVRRAERRLTGQAVTPADPVVEEAGAYDEMFWIARPEGFLRVEVRDIQRIEAARDYVLIHTPTKTFIHRITMRELSRRLDPVELTRVHRSAFVRLAAVRMAERSGRRIARLHLEDGAIVEVGVSYAAAVAEALRLGRPEADADAGAA